MEKVKERLIRERRGMFNFITLIRFFKRKEVYQLICSITSHWKKNKHLAENQSLPSRWENQTRI